MGDSRDRTDNGTDKRDCVSKTAVIDAVDRAISRLRYGVIHLSIHDGKVVQLEITERRRFS
jgi:hypothetical protein